MVRARRGSDAAEKFRGESAALIAEAPLRAFWFSASGFWLAFSQSSGSIVGDAVERSLTPESADPRLHCDPRPPPNQSMKLTTGSFAINF